MKYLIVTILCCIAAGIAVAASPSTNLVLTVADGVAERTLQFGRASGATAGIDPAAGECELPPPPPTGAFDVRFSLDHLGVAGLQGLASDYRSDKLIAATFHVRVQRRGNAPLTFRWVLPAGVTARLRDPFGARILDQPMERSGSLIYDGRALTEFAIDVQFSSPAVGPSTEPAIRTPLVFGLGGNFPNPFNPATRLHYRIAENGPATLAIYDITGRLVETLVDGTLGAGAYDVTWDASSVAGGVYLARLTAGGSVDVRRLLLLK